MSDYREKLLSIAAPRKSGKAEVKVEQAEGAKVITTEHWDGRKDATVRPNVVRFGARVHSMGKQKGQTAEVIPLSRKKSKEKYGDGG